MRNTYTLSRRPDLDQGKLDNKEQTIFKTRPIQLYRVDKEDKWWKEFKDMEDCIKEEVKRIVESKEERWKRER